MKYLFVILFISSSLFAQLPLNLYGFNDNPSICFVPTDGNVISIRHVSVPISWVSTTLTVPDQNDWHILEVVSLDGTFYFRDSVYVKNTTTPSGCRDGYYLNQILEYNKWYRWRVTARRTGYADSYTKWHSFRTLAINIPKIPTLTITAPYKITGLQVDVSCGGRGDYYNIDHRYAGEDPRYPVDTYAFEIRKVSDNSLIAITNDEPGNAYYTGGNYPSGLFKELTGLSLNYSTQYKIRAIVKNAAGTNYSAYTNFTTVSSSGLPSAPTLLFPENNRENVKSPYTFKWRKVLNNPTRYYLRISKSDSVKYNFMISDTIYYFTGDFENNKKYTWTVAGANSVGIGNWANPDTFVTASPIVPSAIFTPILLSPSDSAMDVSLIPTMSWSSDNSVTSYTIEIYNGSTLIYSKNSSINRLTLPTTILKDNYYTQYKWRVKATNSVGVGTSNWSYFTTIPEPSQPLGFVLLKSPLSGEQNLSIPITFKWYRATSATNYNFNLWDITSTDTLIFTYNALSQSDTSLVLDSLILTHGHKYYWYVRARNSTSTSTSSYRYFSTVIETLPDTVINPGNVILLSPEADTVSFTLPHTFKWNSATNATSYNFECYSLLYGRLVSVTSTDTFYTMSSGSLSDINRWRVCAINTNKRGNWSERYFYTIDSIANPVITTAPTLLLPSDNTRKVEIPIIFKWNKVKYATRYNFYLNVVGQSSSIINIDYLEDTTYTLSNSQILHDGVKYNWKVAAINDYTTPPYVYSSPRKFTMNEASDSIALSSGILFYANFTNDQYDSTYFKRYQVCGVADSLRKIKIKNERIQIDDGFYATCPYWYSDRFGSVGSSTTSDMSISSKLWHSNGTISEAGISIAPTIGYDTTYITLGTFQHNAYQTIRLHIKQSGTDIYDQYLDGLSCMDSSRVYKIFYNRNTDEIKFYYKPDTNSTNWQQIGTTQILDLDTLHLIGGAYAQTQSYAGTQYIDNVGIIYSPYVPPDIDTLAFIVPSRTIYRGNETLTVSWYSTKDTVQLICMGDTTLVSDSTHFNIILPDSTFDLTVKGSLLNPKPNSFSSDSLIFHIYQNRFLIIDTVITTPQNITVRTISRNIDTLKCSFSSDSLYWWIAGIYNTNLITDTDTTDFVFSTSSSMVSPIKYIKVTEYRDTTAWIYSKRNFAVSISNGQIGQPDQGECHIWEGTPWSNRFLHNIGCGWVSGIKTTAGIYHVSGISNDLSRISFYYSTFPDSFDIHNYCEESYQETGDSIEFNNWGFKSAEINDSLQIVITDKLRMAQRYLNVERLVTFSQRSSFTSYFALYHPLAMRITYSPIFSFNECTGETINNSSLLLFIGNRPQPAFLWTEGMVGSWSGSPGLPFGISTLPPTFYIIRLSDVFYSAPSDPSPLLFDIWNNQIEGSGIIKVVRNYFRGIHPKIWKYGNINGVRP